MFIRLTEQTTNGPQPHWLNVERIVGFYETGEHGRTVTAIELVGETRRIWVSEKPDQIIKGYVGVEIKKAVLAESVKLDAQDDPIGNFLDRLIRGR